MLELPVDIFIDISLGGGVGRFYGRQNGVPKNDYFIRAKFL